MRVAKNSYKMPLRVLITDYWCAYNQGDTTRICVIKDIVKSIDRNAVITIAAELPKIAEKFHNETVIRECVYNQLLRFFSWVFTSLLWVVVGRRLKIQPRYLGANSAQENFLLTLARSHVMIAGGGFGLNENPIWGLLSRLHNYNLAKILGVKVVLLAQTIAPSSKTWLRNLIRSAVERLDLVLVRDSVSVHYLARSNKPIEKTADLAWLLNGEDSNKARTTENKLGDYAVLAVRHVCKDNTPYESYITKISNFIINELNLRVVFMSTFVIPESEELDLLNLGEDGMDFLVAKRIESKIQKKDRLSVVNSNSTFNDTVNYVKRAHFVVSSRMHLCIFAMKNGVPAFGVTTSNDRFEPERTKRAGIFHDLGLEQYLIPWDKTLPEDIFPLIKSTENNRHEISNEILGKAQIATTRSERNAVLLKELCISSLYAGDRRERSVYAEN